MTDFNAQSGEVSLSGTDAGEGVPVLLLHGLTATRRYVVMGSKHLERNGYRAVAYDARGHGESSPAASYGYDGLSADLAAVMDELGIESAVVAGASMGAHTALRFGLAHPERVSALVVITPAFDGSVNAEDENWDALADGLERDGIEGFLAAMKPPSDPRWHDTAVTVARQRLERHRDLDAVAQALREVPRSRPFEGLQALEGLDVPTLIVASRDESDPGHPLRVAEAYHSRLRRSELMVEEPGKSPIAWQGAQLSRAIAEFARRTGA